MSVNNDFQFNVRDSMYFRFSMKYKQLFPRNVRRVIEFVFLFEAILVLYSFVFYHITLAQPANCLDHIIDIWPKNGILRVEIIQNYRRYPEQKAKINKFSREENVYERDFRLENALYKRNKTLSLFNNFIKISNPGKKEEVDIEPLTVELVENKFRETNTLKPNFYSEPFTNNKNVEVVGKEKTSFSSQVNFTECSNNFIANTLVVNNCSLHQSKDNTLPPIEKNREIFYENYIVEYSLNEANLYLSSEARNGLEIPVMLVTLDPTQNKCFGNSLNRYFLENYIGYDELLCSSIKAVAKLEENKGFMRNVITRKNYPIVVNTHRDRASYISSFFIMIIITYMISLYTRYLNYQLVVALNYLLNNFNGEVGLFKCYMCFLGFLGLSSLILIYFQDLEALFYIMFIVVLAEIYYAVFTHSETTKKHWPKFFYLYLFMFYAYDYRFDGQHRFLSLCCSWSFILHSMIYFYHHVELPYVEQRIELMDMFSQRQLQYLRQQDRSPNRQGSRAP